MKEKDKTASKLTKAMIIVSVIIAAVSIYLLVAIDLPKKPLAGQGGAPEENTLIGGGFLLNDHNGNKFNSDQLKGKFSLVYFGFTFCPDICPTTLQKITTVISTLDKYRIDVQPVFITIDPARDTPALLKEYLGHFHPKFIGLTGASEQIKEVAELYKVFYAVAEGNKDAADKYMLDHSSFVYLLDKNGKYIKHFYMSSTPEEIIEYIRVNK